VPQHVRLPLTPEEHAVLELRVCQPVEKAVRVRLSADQDVLLTKRLRYVRPSEMIRLELAEEWNPRLAAARALRVDLIED